MNHRSIVEGFHRATKTKKAAAAPEPEVDEVEETDTDEELEELEDDEVEDSAPKKSSKTPTVTFGASDLAKLASDKLGIKLDAKNLRVLLRKMARDGRLDRKVEQGNRTRYDWAGPDDPEVKAILKALKSGELEKDKQEKLQALKDRKAKKGADAGKTKGKGKTKQAEPEVEEDDDEDDE